MGQVQAEEVGGAAGCVAAPLGERAVLRSVQDPRQQPPRAHRRQPLLGGARQQAARAPAQMGRVYVHIDVALARYRAVVGDGQLRGADHLAVRLGDELLVVGLGRCERGHVEQGLGGADQEGQGQPSYLDESRGVRGIGGAEVAHDRCHVCARYAGRTVGCLRISGGYGTIAA